MNARFAGSRTLDERRRRRLAVHEHESAIGSADSRTDEEPVSEDRIVEASTRLFPIRKLISPKPWKIAVAVILAFLLGGGLVAGGASAFQDDFPAIAGWQNMFAQRENPARLWEAALLMASGQLAMLIWWGRSQSLRDFEGQYRSWLWSAILAMTAGWSLLGDWHGALSDSICAVWSAQFPQREVVCWMLPALFLAFLIWRKLRADMRNCRWSTSFLWLTAIALVAACVFRLGIDRSGWPDPVRNLAGESLQMLACVSLFSGLLVHARYVLHVSPEPPQPRTSLMVRMLGRLWNLVKKIPVPRLKIKLPKLRKRKPKTNTKDVAKKEPAKAANSKTKDTAQAEAEISKSPSKPAASKPKKPKRTKRAASKQTASSAEAGQEKVQPARKPDADKDGANRGAVIRETPPAEPPAPEPKQTVKDAKPKAEPEATTESKEAEPQLRVDPIDPNMLKGLSKKERRRLRKQHREAQRKSEF